MLKSEAKRQYTYLSIFDVKSNMREKKRENGPCLPNFHSSANKVREKRFSQSYRTANKLLYLPNDYLNTHILLKSEAKRQYTYLSYFDVRSNVTKNGPSLLTYSFSENQF